MATDTRLSKIKYKDLWFNPALRSRKYERFGDAYNDTMYRDLAGKWKVDRTDEEKNKYLTYVERASENSWIHLRLLADFMQIGRIPRDWTSATEPPVQGDNKQAERWDRTRICIMDYFPDKVEKIDVDDIVTLKSELNGQGSTVAPFRLYVVEDLSRNVIEQLGSELNIEPDFFRAHIVDYAWYNVRDRWREPQPLELVRRQRNWFQIRYVAPRYFENQAEFKAALDEAAEFNILRRPDDDKSKGWWDIGGQGQYTAVGLTRSRATFWLKPQSTGDNKAVGVLLLDPTVSKGLPLWRGHRNFHSVPSFQDFKAGCKWPRWNAPSNPVGKEPGEKSFFEDFVYWAENYQVFASHGHARKEHVPIQALLHLISSEWLTMCDYIKTRLNQMDLEIVSPEHFTEAKHVDVALGKLHMWRRFIPLYREMVGETLHHVFRFPSNSEVLANDGSQDVDSTARDRPKTGTEMSKMSSTGSIKAYEEDFRLVLEYLEEYQARIDRLTSVVTAVMAIDDSRRAVNDARNLGRLTWLATFFIPFGIISGIFSMQQLSDISTESLRVYFGVSIPLAVLTLALAWALYSPDVRGRLKRLGQILGVCWKRMQGKEDDDSQGGLLPR